MNLQSEIVPFVVSLAINSMLLGFPLTVGVALAFRVTRAASPRARYLVVVSAFFIAALLPFIVTFNPAHQAEYRQLRSHPPNATDISGKGESLNSLSLFRPEPRTSISASSVSALNAYVRAASESSSATSVLGLYVFVAILLIGREAAGHVRLARARRSWRAADAQERCEMNLPAGVPLYVDGREGPFTVGIIRPAIVVPARLFGEMPSETACWVARHELSHVRWRDPAVNALLRVVRAVLWLNPSLWVLERIARVEREAAADRAAIRQSQVNSAAASTAADYASALVSIAKWSGNTVNRQRYRLIATEVGSKSGLEARVRRLLMVQSKLTLSRLSLASVALTGAVVVMILCPVAIPSKASLASQDHFEEVHTVTQETSTVAVEHSVEVSSVAEPVARESVRRATTTGKQTVAPASITDGNDAEEYQDARPEQISNQIATGSNRITVQGCDRDENNSSTAPQQLQSVRHPRIPPEIERRMRELEEQMREMAAPRLRELEGQVHAKYQPEMRSLSRQMDEATTPEARRDILKKLRELGRRMQATIEPQINEVMRQVRGAFKPQLDELERQVHAVANQEPFE